MNTYMKSVLQIQDIFKNTKCAISEANSLDTCLASSDEFDKYFHKAAEFILKAVDYEEKFNDHYLKSTSFEGLLNENNEFFCELEPGNYEKSYANPQFSVEKFGEGVGQLFSFLYVGLRGYVEYAVTHQRPKIEAYNSAFVMVYEKVHSGNCDYEEIKEILKKSKANYLMEFSKENTAEMFSGAINKYADIAEKSDFSDLKYLFRYGKYISKNEIQYARFLLNYSENKIKEMSKLTVDAFLYSFKRDNKDMKERNAIKLIYNIGQEPLLKHLMIELKSRGYEFFTSMVETTKANRQYPYDHRFDSAIYLDQDFAKIQMECYEKGMEANKAILDKYCGVIYFENFGESAFSPEDKKGNLKLTEEQSKLLHKINSFVGTVRNKYIPKEESSFCMIAFPTPEIGHRFEEIFEDVLRINTLDNGEYELLQQKIVDALDRADYVHVKGKGKNRTDIKVKCFELKNPEKESNFFNCTADANIPVGEVYTTPKLEGTEGILHIEDTYLEGLKYIDLELTFKDGYVVEYDCKNFHNPEENKKYIEENLLFPHKTLPLGEFAIGTNTLAHVVAKKYDILHIMPVLIVEKMGPHFAIGDTCYSKCEDLPVYNMLDHKEITARDNERSIIRKTNEEDAYTYCHTDITLPYESILFISSVMCNSDKVDIIREGRFVLSGTEKLNKYLDE